MADLPLLGYHRQIVSEILSLFEELQSGEKNKPTAVLLRGGSGTGKSRIIREVYRRLCSQQPEPAFWPEIDILPESSDSSRSLNPLSERKVLGPNLDTFVWPANSLPSFGWWAFGCEKLNSTGAVASILFDAAESARKLLVPLSMANTANASYWEKFRRNYPIVMKDLQEEGIEQIGEVALSALQNLIGTTIPGADSIARLVWRIGGSVRERAKKQHMMQRDTDLARIEDGSEDVGTEVANMIIGSATANVPGIVAIEDAHWADEDMLKLLSLVVQPIDKQPVLTMLTAWPEGESHAQWRNWVADNESAGLLRIIDVPDLRNDDLIEILRYYAPSTNLADAIRILDAFPSKTPLMIRLWATRESIKNRIKNHGDALDSTPAVLVSIPESIGGVYRQRWEELSNDIKSALIVALASVPDNPHTPSYLRGIVLRAVEVLPFEFLSNISSGLNKAVDPAAWIQTQNGVDSFREEAMTRTVREETSALFLEDDLTLLRARTVQVLREAFMEWADEGGWVESTPRSVKAAQWLLALTDREIAEPADAYAAWLLGRTLIETFKYVEAAELFIKAASKMNDREKYLLLSNAGRLMSSTGQVDGAVTLLQMVLEKQSRKFGKTNEQTFETRINLARAMIIRGNPDEAISMLSEIVADRIRTNGSDDSRTLDAQSLLAHSLMAARRLNDAVNAYKTVIDKKAKILGKQDTRYLADCSSLGALLGQIGNFRDAKAREDTILMLRDGLDALIKEVGSNHWLIFQSMNNLAHVLRSCGHPDEAILWFERAIAGRERILGPNHLQTLASRSGRALALETAGRYGEAETAYNEVIAEQTRVLGAGHPSTLISQNNYVLMLMRINRATESIPILEAMVTESSSFHGETNPLTFKYRGTLALALSETGQLEEALKMYEQLLEEEQRELGRSDVETLTTMRSYARTLRRAGNPVKAVDFYRELLAIQQLERKDDARTLFLIREELAAALFTSGDIVQAKEILESLVLDEQGKLGANEEDLNRVEGYLRQIEL